MCTVMESPVTLLREKGDSGERGKLFDRMFLSWLSRGGMFANCETVQIPYDKDPSLKQ